MSLMCFFIIIILLFKKPLTFVNENGSTMDGGVGLSFLFRRNGKPVGLIRPQTTFPSPGLKAKLLMFMLVKDELEIFPKKMCSKVTIAIKEN